MRIDHVIYGTADLDRATARVEADLGLTAVPGGRHEGVGTHNRIVSLGDGSFIELLAVADAREAAGSEFGAALVAGIARREGLLAWAVAVDDVGAVAARLRAPLSSGGRRGRRARLPAVLEALAEPCLPFFIERGAPRTAGTGGIGWIEVAGDPRRIEDWLDGAGLPVRVVAGEPSVRAVGIGERELRTG